MTKLITASAALTACLLATAANANTVLLSYDGQGEKVRNDTQTYDFFSLNPFGPVQVFSAEQDAELVPPPVFGPYQADGLADFRINTQQTVRNENNEIIERGFGEIEFLTQSTSPFLPNFAREVGVETIQEFEFPPFGPRLTQVGHFATINGELATFGDGGENGYIVDDSFDFTMSQAGLYGPDVKPNVLTGNDKTAILGFKVDVFFDDFFLEVAELSYESCEEFGPVALEGINECEIIFLPEPEIAYSFFGFIEVTRGSVTPGILGVSTFDSDEAIVPSTVPVPASILLLGAGLGGLGLMRRRKAA